MKIKKEKSPIRKWLYRVWIAGGLFFMVWQWSAFQARGLPTGVLDSDDTVNITKTENYILFESVKKEPNMEVIFLQGALADPEAYAPLCRKLAESGFDTRPVKADFRLPIHFKEEILKIAEQSDKEIVIGGHSQGAKVAAELIHQNPILFEALFLLGSSHPRDIDLSTLNSHVFKIYAEHDGLASVEEVKENLDKMPPHAITKLVEGGNHSQFGYLGHLFMDDAATISLKKQQEITEKELVQFLNDIKKPDVKAHRMRLFKNRKTMNINFKCVKCGHHGYETGEIRATGGTLSKIFDIQNKKFSHVTCQRCKYTEFYKADTGALSNIFDFFTG